MTRAEFRSKAPEISCAVAGVNFAPMKPKQHSTGSLGWRHDDKMTIKIGEEYVKCQVSLVVTVVKSKTMEEGTTEPAPPTGAVA